MATRFKGLRQAEIVKLVNECDEQIYADSDSDCEFLYLQKSVNYFVYNRNCGNTP